jgi:hypothetical protein
MTIVNLRFKPDCLVLMLIFSGCTPHVLKIFQILRTISSSSRHLILATLRCAHTNDCSIGSWFPSILIALTLSCKIQNILVKLIEHHYTFNNTAVLYISRTCTLSLKSWRVSFSSIGEHRRIQTSECRSLTAHHSLSKRVFNLPNMELHSTSLLKIYWRNYIRIRKTLKL